MTIIYNSIFKDFQKMVQYSSRVGSGGNANPKSAGKPPKKKKPVEGSGGDIARGNNPGKGGALGKGAGIVSGGDVAKVLADASIPKNEKKGGAIPPKVAQKIDKAVEKAAGVLSKIGLSKPVKAVTRTSEQVVDRLQNIVGRLTHHGMTQVLQNMNPMEFHTLQGVAGAHLPAFNAHPMAGIAKQLLGGSFTHPRNISKIATRDIMRAITPQQLAVALHMELMDAQKGLPTGGGLLSSLKHHVSRGLDGLKSKVQSGLHFGRSMQSALKRGIEFGQAFSPVVNALFPGAGALLSTGITAAQALQAGLEKGVRVGEKLEAGIESISPDVGEGEEVVAGAPAEPVTTAIQQLEPSQLTEQDIATLGFTPG